MTLDWSFVPGIDLEKEPTVTKVDGGELREWPGCRIWVPDGLGEVGPAEAKGDGCRSHHGAPQETVEAILDRLWPQIAECRTAKALGVVIIAAEVAVKMKRPLALAARDKLGATWTDRTVRCWLFPARHSETWAEKQREAVRRASLAWYAHPKNAEKARESSRTWRADPVNAEKHREACRAWYAVPENAKRQKNIRQADPEKAKKNREASRAWYAIPENAARSRERSRCYLSNPANAAKHRERTRAYYASNPEYKNDYAKARYRDDPVFAIVARLRSRLASAVKAAGTGKVGKTFDLIALTPDELAAHLEAQFVDGMGWHNRELWHVDHIRPMAAFDLTDPAQQAAAMHYSNLKPVWASDNLAKGSLHDGKRHCHRKSK